MSTVLVTGGAGFIGSHLCDRLLAEGRDVVAVDDLSSGHVANLVEARGYGRRFTFYGVDIRARGLGEIVEGHRPEVVVHLAARSDRRPGADRPGVAGEGIMGLLNVLETAVRCGARKVVLAVSAGVYGEVRSLPINETALPGARPVTTEGISGRIACDYLRFYRSHRGLDHAVLVLGSIYGPRQYPGDGRGVVASLAGAMLSGDQPGIEGDGSQTRDFVFVDDVVHALSLATERGSGQPMNVGTGFETSVSALFRMLCDITGFRGPPTFGPSRPGETGRSALDAGLAERELGWRPWTHLEDGLRETVAFLRA